ncbi:MAG: hypothetical protein WC343_03715 [Bacilli bacterium]
MNRICKLSELYETVQWPIKTAADIVNGALLMPGVTAETDLGTLILASSACADSVGTMAGLFDYSVKGTSAVSGATWVTAPVKPIFDCPVIEVAYDTSDTMALASDESSKTITITSLEDNIDTSYLYCVSGTGIGQLRFIDTSASGSCTIATAGDPEWDSADTCIKILRLFHPLAKLNSAGTKLGTDAAAGSWTVAIIQNYIERQGLRQVLDPTKHDGLSGLNASNINVKFIAHVGVRNNLVQTID